MTMNWNQMETANGAGADALTAAMQVFSVPERRIVRALRWKQDAVCRDASADERLCDNEADSTGSSLTRTIFHTSRIQTQPLTRKETQNTNQEKKGKQPKTSNHFFARKPETLA